MIEPFEARIEPATFVVGSLVDGGAGLLRAAIAEATIIWPRTWSDIGPGIDVVAMDDFITPNPAPCPLVDGDFLNELDGL